MSDFSKTMKDLLSRSAKFIGRTFHSAASETKYKANELSLNNKRRELIHELGKKVLELSAAGHVLPAEATEIISQINKLDGDMNVLRNDHAAKKAAAAEQYAMEKAARATEKAAAQAAAADAGRSEDVRAPAAGFGDHGGGIVSGIYADDRVDQPEDRGDPGDPAGCGRLRRGCGGDEGRHARGDRASAEGREDRAASSSEISLLPCKGGKAVVKYN